VAEVLRGSEALVVSADGRRVRRAVPLDPPEELARAIDARSLYAAPFPYTATLDDLTAFFGGAAPVNCVRQRRHLGSKDFKGNCFIEFASVEAASQVAHPPPVCLPKRTGALHGRPGRPWPALAAWSAVTVTPSQPQLCMGLLCTAALVRAALAAARCWAWRWSTRARRSPWSASRTTSRAARRRRRTRPRRRRCALSRRSRA
jgi:hypothetical protein